MTGFRGTSRRCGGSFAKQVAGNVDKDKASLLLREHLKICFDENFDGPLVRKNLDTNGGVAKVNFVPSSIPSSNDGVGHYRLGLRDQRCLLLLKKGRI